MTATSTDAAQVRAQVDHPIIDADGHFVEVGPLLHDEIITYLEEAGGAALRDRFLASAARALDTSTALADRSDPTVRDQWRAMPSWWGWQTHNLRDRATSHLPALLYERLDEIGIDFTILYPSMASGTSRVRRRALVGAVPRGEPLPRARVRAVPRPVHGRRHRADEHSRRRRSPRPSTRCASSARSRC